MLKTITAALAADTTLLTITDAAINDSSIIEVYTDDDDLFPKSISQTGNTLSIIFDEQITVHAVKILVNNLSGEFIPFSGDYSDLSNKPSIPDIDVIPLLEEGEHIADIDLNGETYSLYAPAGSAEVSAEDVSYDNSVSELIAENIQNAIDELNTQKQPLLTAGDGIDITDNVISATGGGAGYNLPDEDDVSIVIGKYGNKDLYCKRLSTTGPHASYTVIGSVPDNSFIVDLKGVFYGQYGGQRIVGPFFANYGGGWENNLQIIGNSLQVTNGTQITSLYVFVFYVIEEE